MIIRIKKKITAYMLGVAIILLLTNVSIDFFNRPKKNIGIQNKELSVNVIDSVFLAVLDHYGIENEWISTSKIKIPFEDSISKQFTVKLPADLSIPLIIKDVNNIIENDITGFVSEEKKIFGTTEIRIYTNEILKLKAVLIPDSSTIRHRSELAFVISDAFDLSTGNFDKFLSVPYELSAIVVPNEANIAKADSLKNYSKEYVELINDDMKETKFKLEAGNQKELLRNSINNIITNFKDAVFISIDERSKLFNSTLYNYVRDEFKNRGVTLVQSAEFLKLASDEESELISKFKFYCDDKENASQKIFLISFDDFQTITPELEKFRKKGNKVIALSNTELVSKLKSIPIENNSTNKKKDSKKKNVLKKKK